MADLSIQGEVTVNAEKAEAAFDRVADKATQMATDVAGAAGKAGQAVDGIGDSAGQGAEKFTRAEARMRDAIQRSTRELQMLGKTASEKLEFNIGLKGLDSGKFAPYLAELKAVEAAQATIGSSAQSAASAVVAAQGNIGMSAKATAAAMAQVPAQFQDIIVSLQGGQAPMTVLLQQGSQLASMFGGVGAAAKALGTYMLSLVNPFTVVAAAAVALGVAYYQGSKESSEFSKALVMSGNAAGQTVDSLSSMADAIAATGRNRGAAVEALTEIASQGLAAGNNLQQFAQVAVDMERVTGQAISKTVGQIAELGNEPAAASAKLNKEFNYLTASIYEQIKALESQGRSTDAAKLAQEAFANSMAARTGQVVQNAGLMERAWNGVASAVKNAWAALQGIGRAQSKADELADVTRQLSGLQRSNEGSAGAFGRFQGDDQQIAALRQRQAALQEEIRLTARSAEAEASKQRIQKAGVEAVEAVSKANEKALTKTEQMNKALGDYRRNLEAIRAANPGSALLDPKQIARTEAGIRDQYKERGGGGGSKTGVAPGENEVARIRAMIQEQQLLTAALNERGIAAEKLTAGEKMVLQIQEQLSGGIKGVARANKEAALAEAQKLVTAEQARIAAEKQAKALDEVRKANEKLVDDTFRSAASINQQAGELEAANAVFGKGKVAIEQYRLKQAEDMLAMAQASDNFIPGYVAALQQVVDARKRLTAAATDAEFKQLNQGIQEWKRNAAEQLSLYQDEAQLAGLTAVEREKIVAVRQIELRLAREIAKINASSQDPDKKLELIDEATAAAAAERSAATARIVQADWQKTADSINQSLTDALLRGFEDGKSFGKNFADTLKNMFKTLVLRPIISWVVQPIGNAISGVINGILGGGQGGGGILGNLFGGGGNSNFLSGLSSLWDAYQGNGMSGVWGQVSNWMGLGGAASGGAGALTFAGYGGATSFGGVTAASAYGAGVAPAASFSGFSGVGGVTAGYGAAGGAGSASGLAGIAGGVAMVALPIIAGMLAERNMRDRAGGAAYATSDWRNDPSVQVGGTSFNTVTGQIPAYQDMVNRMVELGYDRNTPLFEQMRGNERAMYVMLQQMESRNRGEYGEHQALPNAEDLMEMYGDFFRGQGYADPESMGWWNRKDPDYASIDPQVVAASRALSQSIVDPLTAMARMLGETADFRVTTGWANRGKGDLWGAANIMRGDETVANLDRADFKNPQEYFRAVYDTALQAFESFDLPAWADKLVSDTQARIDALTGDKVGEEAAALYQGATNEIARTYAAINQLIEVFPDFRNATQDTVYALAEAMGGMDNLSSAYGGYVSNFYSPDEQHAFAWSQIEAALTEVGLATPATRDGFRALVESLDLSTESGRAAFAALMNVQGAFASLTDTANTSADSLGMTADSIKGMLSKILTEAQSAGEARVMGEQAAGEMFMGAITSVMLDAVTSGIMSGMVDPLVSQITSGAAAAAAIDVAGATTSAAAMATGGSVAAGTMAAGGASAAGSMAAGGASAGASMSAVVSQVVSTMQTMTSVFSSAEFQEAYQAFTSGMGEISGALFENIGAIGVAVGHGGGFSGGGGGGSPNSASSAMDDLAETIKRLGKTVAEEVKRLRGLINDQSEFGLAYLQAQFATTTAQARAGDVNALGKLPELSKAIDDMVSQSAMTSIESIRNQAWLADSLEKTLGTFGLTLADFEKQTGDIKVSTAGKTYTKEEPTTIDAAIRTVTISGSADLLVELKGLRAEVAALKAHVQATEKNTNGLPQLVDQFDNVTEGGNAMREVAI